jgi:hypothetical protein
MVGICIYPGDLLVMALERGAIGRTAFSEWLVVLGILAAGVSGSVAGTVVGLYIERLILGVARFRVVSEKAGKLLLSNRGTTAAIVATALFGNIYYVMSEAIEGVSPEVFCAGAIVGFGFGYFRMRAEKRKIGDAVGGRFAPK